jgi:hypothetical protein
VKAIISEDYDYAERLERLSTDRRLTADRREQSSVLAERIKKARADLADENEEWDRLFDAFRREQRRQREELVASHAEAELRYEAKWNRADALVAFSKSSPELLRLRKMQKTLALARKFAEAREVKQRADAMQRQEARTGEERAIGSVRAGLLALQQRQQRELECFNRHERGLLARLEIERAKATEPLVTLIRTLKAATERAEGPVRIPRKPIVANSRAASQLDEFKRSDEPQRLGLNPRTVRRFAAKSRRFLV